MLNDTALMNSYKEEVDSPYTDSLTGLFNHGFFIHSLAREIENSMRYNVPVTLALIDIDSFARYNKRHDPFKGDRALKEIADIVKNNIRKVDLAARFSGNVFAVIYTKSDNALAAGSVERIREEVKKRFGGEPTLSLALASHPADAKTDEELLGRAEEALVHAKMKGTNTVSDSLSTIEKALMSLANAIEGKDEHTKGHVQRVASMAVALGQKMGLSEKEIGALRLGSILHDIGNIEVSGDILRKPSSLSEKEWKVIKAHPDAGYRMCLPLARNLGLALQIIRHHHERPDGSGYPDGLSAEEISVPCQIMTVVDIYDALTNDRPFRRAMDKQEAIEILRQEVKEGKLDKEIVQQLIDIVGDGRADGK